MQKALLVLAAIVLMTACSQFKEEKTPEQLDKDSITSAPWCVVDKVAPQEYVMTRLTFSESQVHWSYIRLNKDIAPVIYKRSEASLWQYKGSPYARHGVEILREATQIVGHKEYKEQERIFNDVIKNNKFIRQNKAVFEPAISLVVRTNGLLESVEQAFYPCAMYSQSLSSEIPARSYIEFQIYLAQELRSYNREHFLMMEKQMALQFPVKEIPMNPAEHDKTQWCSWFGMERGRLFLKTITLGQNKYITNSHTDLSIFEEDGKDVSYDQLKTYAEGSQSYDISYKSAGITGKHERWGDGSYLYTLVEDANGSKALVERFVKNPESSSMIFADIYFDCNNTVPLKHSPSFKKYLKTILELQLEQLAK
ncbi:hypothetical protein [Bdellovibrio sp. HCB337]|uniref:hypothetical protein n=1 Tax=Bdellovibrio sp. HCB337 TaxID=3394358 RepID=UPI0039A54768